MPQAAIHEPVGSDMALDYMGAFDNAHQRVELMVFEHLDLVFDAEFPSSFEN